MRCGATTIPCRDTITYEVCSPDGNGADCCMRKESHAYDCLISPGCSNGTAMVTISGGE